MKRFICLLTCTCVVLLLCSCANKNAATQQSVPESQPVQSLETTHSNQETETQTEPVTEPEATEPSQETNPTEPVTEVPTEPAPTEPPAPISTPVVLELSRYSYTVTDPGNTRGLSVEGYGFSYGVAKDGVPHNQSVINQQTFDAFDHVQALALDTQTQEKIMYLTFDNGYEYENLTADILDTLKEKGVKAAFFVTLSYVKQNPQLVQRMIDEGHIVGNHSSTHPSFPKLDRVAMAQEIATLDNYLRENFGYSSPYFRFPSGEYSECALELVTAIGFRSIFWSAAYADWDTTTQKGADYAFSTVTSRFHPGAVILLHAVSQDNADALGRIIDEARNQGYSFATLDSYSY